MLLYHIESGDPDKRRDTHPFDALNAEAFPAVGTGSASHAIVHGLILSLLDPGHSYLADSTTAIHDGVKTSADPRHKNPDGRFVRIAPNPDGVTVQIDSIGLYASYYRIVDSSFRMSNVVASLFKPDEPKSVDTLGAALFAELGYIPGGHTLVAGVSAMAGGTWSLKADRQPTRIATEPSYLRISDSRQDPQDLAESYFDHLQRNLSDVSSQYAQTLIGLTAGLDSRLIVSAATAAGIDFTSYTRGAPGDVDVEYAAAIARRCRIPHRTLTQNVPSVVERFDQLSRILLDRTDGMVSVWQVGDVDDVPQDGPGTLLVGGIGGEIARGYYGSKKVTNACEAGPTEAVTALCAKIRPTETWLRPEAAAAVQAELERLLKDHLANGVNTHDLPDAYYTDARVRRWGGSNARKVSPISETYAPLASQATIDAALSLSPEARKRQELHLRAFDVAPKRFREIPFADGTWPSISHRRPSWLARRRASTLRKRTEVTEGIGARVMRALARALAGEILDCSSSSAWLVVDRRHIERLITQDPASLSPADLNRLASVSTLVRYEASWETTISSRGVNR